MYTKTNPVWWKYIINFDCGYYRLKQYCNDVIIMNILAYYSTINRILNELYMNRLLPNIACNIWYTL